MTEQLNIYQKLAKIRDIAEAVAKTRSGYNYKYADLNEILAKVKGGMKRYGVSLIPSIVPNTAIVEQNNVVNTKFDKTGKPYDQTTTEMLYKADAVFTWVNDENPDEKVCVPWTVTGAQGDPSQAFGSGMTYCIRYFLSDFFQVALVDNVDDYRSKQRAAETSEDRAIAEEIIGQIDKLVRKYIAESPNKAKEVQQFLSKYAKNADYFKITDPELAANLLENFTNTYCKGE